MRIWCISDTHRHHRGLALPEDIDMVIHAGDATNSMNVATNAVEMEDFLEWYSALKVGTKIFVPGNHDTSYEAGMFSRWDMDMNVLVHDLFSLHVGVGGDPPYEKHTVFGSPYTPRFHDWAYMKRRNQLDQVWQTVPEDTDILVTHGPPQMIMDLTQDREGNGLVSVGCKALWNHVTKRIRPKLHIFGHLHDEPGVRNAGILDIGCGTKFVNASCCDLRGNLVRNGFVVEI